MTGRTIHISRTGTRTSRTLASKRRTVAIDEAIDDARAEGLAAREYFVVFTKPKSSREDVQEHLQIHLEYQRSLERRGIIVAAGPLSDESGQEWTGRGLIVLRVKSLEEARKVADADPMHRDGVRSYEIFPWLMNERSFTLKVSLAGQKIEFN